MIVEAGTMIPAFLLSYLGTGEAPLNLACILLSGELTKTYSAMNIYTKPSNADQYEAIAQIARERMDVLEERNLTFHNKAKELNERILKIARMIEEIQE
ncbi:hypothetical protein DYBT9623_00664 [Dyadobacter sp. CECT 9623]|uniref:Uncharacterized protein n=2 Tax=Dyadobacter linearis TaxID=2823330 RepID=A0ABM8UKD1_9BACT|nr:hypothetical protein DYBT9623_00664 [Dyadobacter sp. CECT 9623]